MRESQLLGINGQNSEHILGLKFQIKKFFYWFLGDKKKGVQRTPLYIL